MERRRRRSPHEVRASVAIKDAFHSIDKDMSEINVKFNGHERSISAPATVADAIKAFDRDALKKSLVAKVNGEEVDLNRELTATVADAIKAFDRDALKKSLVAKVNGEEVDLNRELTATDEVLSIEPVSADSREGLEVIRHSTAH